MNLLARARGLQERIRPDHILLQGEKRATFASLKMVLTHGRKWRSLLGPPRLRIAPTSKLSTREAGRIILNLLHHREGSPPHSPPPKSPLP